MATENERELFEFSERLVQKGIPFETFLEPDLGHELTAIALHPSEAAKRACSSLPLALRELPDPSCLKREAQLRRVVRDMQNCEQIEGLSVLGHGLAVRDRLFELLDYIDGAPLRSDWRLPDWVDKYSDQLRERTFDRYTLAKYTIFHDCGKPYCREVDEEGRVHFPEHSKVSGDTWRTFSDDERVERLIRMDMDIHLIKAKGVPEFSERPEAVSLMLTGLAEVHANADMFGGIESTSFKIKQKQIKRRGRAVCKRLFVTGGSQ